jgi:hypothetical protein
MENNPELDARRTRAAQNQSLFRDLNEQVLAAEDKWGEDSEFRPFVCECLDLNCAGRIDLSRNEYERLRETPTRFAVLEGHEVPDVEVVVEKTDRYLVVRKIGTAAEEAEALNPRA